MGPRIFRPEPMDLKGDFLRIPLEERLAYDRRQSNIFFVNFEGLEITRSEEIDAINEMIEKLLGPLTDKVSAVVNSGNCVASLELVDRYLHTLRLVRERYCTDTTRFTTSAFVRMKLGSALQQHDAGSSTRASPRRQRTHAVR
jgi:propionate CoA-transferase